MAAKKQAVKKKTKKQDWKCSVSQEEMLEFINKSRGMASTVLECGSDWASTCHEVNDKASDVATKLGFKQENYYSQFTA
tara:strand:+ start:443 stop:679 length:237 start_codon:yes stop_codon:yes gene_type:complete